MKTYILVSSILGVLLLLTFVATGQPSLPTGPTQAPIDGGLSLVAAAGGAYAWKKYRNKSKAE